MIVAIGPIHVRFGKEVIKIKSKTKAKIPPIDNPT